MISDAALVRISLNAKMAQEDFNRFLASIGKAPIKVGVLPKPAPVPEEPDLPAALPVRQRVLDF